MLFLSASALICLLPFYYVITVSFSDPTSVKSYVFRLIFSFPAPIILALCINELKIKRLGFFKNFVQTAVYIPHFVSWVIFGGIIVQFLFPSTGLVNQILQLFRVKPIYFLTDPKWFQPVIVIIDIWKTTGWGAIIYLAALSGVDPSLYDAAEIDGASSFNQIVHVTLPAIADTIVFIMLLNVGRILMIGFEQIYVPANRMVRVECASGRAEIAVAGAMTSPAPDPAKAMAATGSFEPFRIRPSEVEIVDVGSGELHCHRRICHILGKNADGRASRLLVSELYCDSGSWSGYPPHKHDTENGSDETDFEEVYHYRFRPENGFGAQLSFQRNGDSACWMTRNGDTFLLDKGYHPTVTSPGHEEYIFTILVGAEHRSLVQNFKEEHRYLMNSIPGIDTMRERFK